MAPASMAGDGARRNLAARSTQGYSGRLELTIRSARVLWRCSGGQIGLRYTGGEESRWRTNVPVAVLRRNSGAGEDRGRGSVLGKVSGRTAKLLCGSGGARRR